MTEMNKISNKPTIIKLVPASESNLGSSRISLKKSVTPSWKQIQSHTLSIKKDFSPIAHENTEFKSTLQKRKFRKKWRMQFPFLMYNKKTNLMYCKLCQQFAQESTREVSFINGTNNFRISAIHYHEKSTLHRKNKHLSENSVNPFKSDENIKKLQGVVKLVYFILKSKSPYSYFPSLCKNQLRHLKPAYTSHHKVVPIFAKYISAHLEENISNQFSGMKMFALILEDIFLRNDEHYSLVFIKYFDVQRIKVVFLGVIKYSNNLPNALHDALLKIMDKYKIHNWKENIVGIATNISLKSTFLSELVKAIKKQHNTIFVDVVFMLSHKISQCYQTLEQNASFMELQNSIYDIFMLLSKLSEDMQHKLPNLSLVMGEIIHEHGSLPKHKSIFVSISTFKALDKDWVSLMYILEHNSTSNILSKNTCFKLLSFIQSSMFLWVLAVSLDLYSVINNFEQKFAWDESEVFSMSCNVEDLCKDIHVVLTEGGITVKEFKRDFCNQYRSFRNKPICIDITLEEVINQFAIIENDITSPLKEFISNGTICASLNFLQTPTLGNSVEKFSELFVAICTSKNLPLAVKEWVMLNNTNNLSSILQNSIDKMSKDSPLIANLCQKLFLLVKTPSKVPSKCHQELNAIKSSERSTLSQESLHNAMLVAIHGASTSEFDPTSCIALWMKGCKRRFGKRTKI